MDWGVVQAMVMSGEKVFLFGKIGGRSAVDTASK